MLDFQSVCSGIGQKIVEHNNDVKLDSYESNTQIYRSSHELRKITDET